MDEDTAMILTLLTLGVLAMGFFFTLKFVTEKTISLMFNVMLISVISFSIVSYCNFRDDRCVVDPKQIIATIQSYVGINIVENIIKKF